jgi:hypothetical protein
LKRKKERNTTMKSVYQSCLPLSFVLLVALGCGSQPAPDPAPGANSHTDAHDHSQCAHNHEELGPNGGHVLMLGEEQYHAEWVHDDEAGKVTVILLDAEAKEEVNTTAEAVTIDVKVLDAEPRQYSLAATNRNEEDPPRASRFELTEPALITAMKIGEGVEAVLNVEIDGQPFSASIEHEAH